MSTIRMVKSSVGYARIEKGCDLTDDEVLVVIAKQAKQRRESIEAAEGGGRADIAERERAELEILFKYLPEQLSEGQIENIVRDVAAEIGVTDIKDRGKLMGPVMRKTQGRADGKLVNQIVERVLRG